MADYKQIRAELNKLIAERDALLADEATQQQQSSEKWKTAGEIASWPKRAARGLGVAAGNIVSPAMLGFPSAPMQALRDLPGREDLERAKERGLEATKPGFEPQGAEALSALAGELIPALTTGGAAATLGKVAGPVMSAVGTGLEILGKGGERVAETGSLEEGVDAMKAPFAFAAAVPVGVGAARGVGALGKYGISKLKNLQPQVVDDFLNNASSWLSKTGTPESVKTAVGDLLKTADDAVEEAGKAVGQFKASIGLPKIVDEPLERAAKHGVGGMKLQTIAKEVKKLNETFAATPEKADTKVLKKLLEYKEHLRNLEFDASGFAQQKSSEIIQRIKSTRNAVDGLIANGYPEVGPKLLALQRRYSDLKSGLNTISTKLNEVVAETGKTVKDPVKAVTSIIKDGAKQFKSEAQKIAKAAKKVTPEKGQQLFSKILEEGKAMMWDTSSAPSLLNIAAEAGKGLTGGFLPSKTLQRAVPVALGKMASTPPSASLVGSPVAASLASILAKRKRKQD